MNKKSLLELLLVMIGSLLILLCRFPWDPPFSEVSVDYSAFWGLNQLFHQDIAQFNHITFHYGPLGFLKLPMPLGNNFLYSLLSQAFLRTSFVFLLLWLGRSYDRQRWMIYGAAAFFLAGFLSFDFVVTGIVASCILLFQVNKKYGWLAFALFIAATGLYVKSSIGIITLSMLVTFSGYVLLKEKKWRTVLFLGFGYLLTTIIVGLALYQNLGGLVHFWTGTAKLLSGGLSGMALYPDNNWWLIGLSALIWLVLPFLIKHKMTTLLYLIFALPLFAAWKHGMIREDSGHIQAFFNFLVLFYTFVILVSKNIRPWQLLLVALSLVLFYSNIANVFGYMPRDIAFLRISENIDLLKNRKKIEAEAWELTQENLQELQLPPHIKKRIGQASVDPYPWEINYIPANQLNWQPRPTIQYFRQNKMMDELNAAHFAGERAPQFIIWHLTDDFRGRGFPSSDNKYLLNEEPLTLASIFSHYDLVEQTDKVLLFEKNKQKHFSPSQSLLKQTGKWDEWISVPASADGLLRVKFLPRNTFLSKLKKKVYKDEAYYVEYQFDNGQTISYRLSSGPMSRGVWVNPFPSTPTNQEIEPLVTAVRFSCSNTNMVKADFDLEWEISPLVKESTVKDFSGAFKVFNKTIKKEVPEQLLVHFHNDFESNEKGQIDSVYQAQAISAGNYQVINKQKRYSSSFVFPVDSSKVNDGWLVKAKMRAYQEEKTDAALVISVENQGKIHFYKAARITNRLSRPDHWEQVDLVAEIPREVLLNGPLELKVYAFNRTKSEVGLDDFEVLVFY